MPPATSNRLTLSASKTTTPGIVIHRAVEATASGKWAITVESCGARLGFAKSENGARAVAGAYAGLPIRWDKIPEFKSREDMKLVVEFWKSGLLRHLNYSNGFTSSKARVRRDSSLAA
jgi:hypothetical protein